jgi:hypothetical protein
MDNLAGTIFTFSGSAVLLLFGIIYLVRPKFMDYHKMAVQKEWTDLALEIQTLILALMRTVGGGFISVALVLMILQTEFNKSHDRRIAITIFIVGVVLNLCTLYATILVRTKTKGRPPTYLTILLLVMLVLGYFFNISGI